MPPKPKSDNEFGTAVNAMLAARRMSQSDLARRMRKKPAFLNQVITGRRPPMPTTVRIIVVAFAADDAERAALHLCAARSIGYEV